MIKQQRNKGTAEDKKRYRSITQTRTQQLQRQGSVAVCSGSVAGVSGSVTGSCWSVLQRTESGKPKGTTKQ